MRYSRRSSAEENFEKPRRSSRERSVWSSGARGKPAALRRSWRIIFGSRMAGRQIARIMQCASEDGYDMSHVQIFQAVPSRASWTFENIPRVMSPCDACKGDGYLAMDSDTQNHHRWRGSPALLIDAVLGFLAPQQAR